MDASCRAMQERAEESLRLTPKRRGAFGVMAAAAALCVVLCLGFSLWRPLAPFSLVPCAAASVLALVLVAASRRYTRQVLAAASRIGARARQAERRAAAREGTFHSVVERSSDGVVVIDGDGTVRFANRAACALLEREGAGLEGRPAPFPREGDDPLEIEVAGSTPPRIVELRKTATDWEGEPARLVLLRNITERTRASWERERLIRELEAKNAELERFTYTVSHDLKAPLITIKGFLGFLEQAAASGDAERLRGDLGRIDKAAERMQRLLDELLHLCLLGKPASPTERMDFADVVEEAAELVRGRLAAEGVRLAVPEGLPAVRGDRSRLVEAMQNLLDNAAKFMGDQRDPTVEVGCRGCDEQGRHILYVRDNGKGIPEEHRERIFGLFNKLSADPDGTGVGLTLVRRIIEAHGGTIRAESPGSGGGRGATFVFTLPPG